MKTPFPRESTDGKGKVRHDSGMWDFAGPLPLADANRRKPRKIPEPKIGEDFADFQYAERMAARIIANPSAQAHLKRFALAVADHTANARKAIAKGDNIAAIAHGFAAGTFHGILGATIQSESTVRKNRYRDDGTRGPRQKTPLWQFVNEWRSSRASNGQATTAGLALRAAKHHFKGSIGCEDESFEKRYWKIYSGTKPQR